jgi:hypothetical protein
MWKVFCINIKDDKKTKNEKNSLKVKTLQIKNDIMQT